MNSPTPTNNPVLLTAEAPTNNPSGDMFDVDVEFDTLTTELVIVELAVLFPSSNEVFDNLTFAPTFAPTEKFPVPIEIVEELTNEFTELLPTLKEEVAAVRLANPSEVKAVLLAIKLDPTVWLNAFTVPVWYTPVVFATKSDPTVNNAELTDDVTFADPTT